MSIASVSYDPYLEQRPVALVREGDWTPGYAERSSYVPLYFVPTVVMALVSWISGGIQILTDISMIVLTCVLAGLFINDLLTFPRRFGIGGIIAFGGALLWWCYDYHIHWLGYRGELTGDAMFSANGIDSVPHWVLAKSVCLHSLFLLFMAVGLQFKRHMWISRLAFKTIEPGNSLILFVIVIAIFLASLIPYLFFAQEDPITAIKLSILAGRSAAGPSWTTGRTGNLNYNWGGYIAQLIQLGYAGATLAAFHAIIFTRSTFQRVVCAGIFALQVALAFGTGARGNVVFVCLPLAIVFFLKYNFVAAELAKRFSFRSYVVTLGLLCAMLFLIQVQGLFRNEGFSAENFQNVEMDSLRGNEMLTTTLPLMALFPNTFDHLDQPYPGAGGLYAIPRTVYWFCINPIPRALWNDKPVDKAWWKYNALTTGRSESDSEGTTISRGAAGDPYMKWGVLGLIEIAVLYGYILRNCEIGMRTARGRVFSMLFLLGTATFIFRAFRDLNFHDYYPVLYGLICMMFIAYVMNHLLGVSPASSQRYRYV
ncbi:MAG: oligosaccharide repeat unit polymerase [Burkholderiales bacterium]|nr:oligosaccharide repeat unit polymerase [Phycisphaerae bacterium]